MRRAEEPETDLPSRIGQPPSSKAPWRVASVTALPDARLQIAFVDGTRGEVHLRTFIDSKQSDGSVFEALRDPAFFVRVRVVSGVVSWPNGADLAPDAMYDAIRKTGTWVVEA